MNVDARIEATTEEFNRFLAAMYVGSTGLWTELDLTMSQFKTLFHIVTASRVNGRELARLLGVGPPAVTSLVDRLVERGYAFRQEDAEDRRVTWIRPTPAGRALFERLTTTGRDRLGAILAELQPEELEVVRRAISILRLAVEAGAPFAPAELVSDER